MQQEAWHDDCICKVCSDIKTEARMLECGHSFCTLCLRDYLMQYEERGVFYSFLMCPVCSIQTATKLGVLSLPRAHHLDEPIEHLKNLWKAKEEKQDFVPTTVSYPVLEQPDNDLHNSTEFGDSSFLAGVEWEDYDQNPENSDSAPSSLPQVEDAPQTEILPPKTPTFTTSDTSKPQTKGNGLKDYFSSFYQPSVVIQPAAPPKEEPKKPISLHKTEEKPLPAANLQEPPKTEISSPPKPQQTEAPKESGGFTGFISSIFDSIKNTIAPPDDVSSTATGRKQEVIYYAPFNVSSENAKKNLSSWLSSLWFAPSDLTTSASTKSLRPMWIPYYSICADSATEFYGFKEELAGNQRKLGGKVSNHYRTILCGTNNQSMLEFIEPFRDNFAIGLAKSPINSLGVPLETPRDWHQVWDAFRPVVDEKEISKCTKEGKAVGLDKVTTLVRFSDIRVKLIYLPIFHGSYQHNGKEYRVAINGQNGKVIGERSYGTGALGSLVGRLWGNK